MIRLRSIAEARARTATAAIVAITLLLAPNAAIGAEGDLALVPQVGATEDSSRQQRIDVSPDGRLVVISGLEGPLQIWSLETERLIRTIGSPRDEINQATFTSDPNIIVAIARDENMTDVVSFFDIRTGEPVFGGEQYAAQYREQALDSYTLAASADRSVVVSGSWDGRIQVWDLATGLPTRTYGDGGALVDAAAVSNDGTLAAAAGEDEQVTVWNLVTGETLFSGTGPGANTTRTIGFAPDNRTVIVVTDAGVFRATDIATGEIVWAGGNASEFAHPGPVSAAGGYLVMSAESRESGYCENDDDRFCVADNFSELFLWSAADGKALKTMPGSEGLLSAIGVSRDGDVVVTYGEEDGISAWRVEDASLLHTFGAKPIATRRGMISPDGEHMVLYDYAQVARYFDARLGAVTAALLTKQLSRALYLTSSDGRQFITENYDQGVSQWDVESGPLGSLQDLSPADQDPGYLLASSPSGEHVAIGLPGGEVAVAALAMSEPILTLSVSGQAVSGAFSPDGRLLAVLGTGDLLEIFDLETGELVQAIPQEFESGLSNAISAVVFPDNETVIANLWGRAPARWDIESGGLVAEYQTGDMFRAPPAVGLQTRLLLSELRGNRIGVFDLDSGQLLQEFGAHRDYVTFLGFFDEGRLAVSSSQDGSTRIWNPSTGEELLLMVTGDQPEDWLAVTPAGFFNFGGSGMELLAVVDGIEGYGVEQFYDALYRPDLVQELLRGDPQLLYADAASRVNLRSILDSGTLPQIEVLTAEQDGDSLHLVAEITDRGGGIGNVSISIQGEDALKAEQRAFESGRGELLGDTSVLRIDRRIPLDPCDEQPCRTAVSIVAFNGENLLASDPVEFTVDAIGITERRGKLFVLAIGVDAYAEGGVRPLNYAVADATKVAEALGRMGEDIYEGVEVTTLLDGEVTAERLDSVFTDLGNRITPDDKFVFYVAGHGATLAGRYYFFPQDFTFANGGSIVEDAIDQDRWNVWFDRITARASLFLYDTCEAGTMADANVQRGEAEVEGAVYRLMNALGRNVIAASTDEQAANEGYNGHGLFTWTLLEAFAAGDRDDNDWIEVSEVQSYVENRVPFLSEERFGVAQQPRYDIRANFPVGAMVAGIAPVEGIPKSHDYFVIAIVPIEDAAGNPTGAMTQQQQVRLLSVEGDRARIARDGIELGYVPMSALVPNN